MHTLLLSRLKPCALSVALAVCGAPLVAQAATITLSAAYSLNGGAVQNGLTSGNAQISGDTVYPTPTGSDFYMFEQSGISNAFFHTYGFVGNPTYFGARASGEGQWTATTTANYATTFTNAGLTAVPLSLSFNVDSGDVGLFGNGTGMADLLLRVRVNGADVARDQTTISMGANGTTCVENDLGSTLSSYTSCGGNGNANQVFGNGGLFTVDLGLVGAGQSIDIDYDIIATTNGAFSSGAVTCNYEPGYGGYGGYETVATQAVSEGGYFCPTFNGIARSGDPFNLPVNDTTPSVNFDPRLNGVPTPGSLALAGLAAAVAWGTRRRRRTA